MKISAVIAMWGCVVFGLACLGAAYTAFSSLQTLTDAAEREMATGYGWFYTFLFVVATLFGVLSWMIKKGKLGATE